MLLEDFLFLTEVEFTRSPFRGTNCESNINNFNLIYLNYYAGLVLEFCKYNISRGFTILWQYSLLNLYSNS